MMIRKLGLGMASAAILVLGVQAGAAELDDLMPVQIEILASCDSIVAPVLDMGQVPQGSPGEAAGNIQVTCGQGVAYNVAVEAGDNFSGGKRRMVDEFATNNEFVPYTIVAGACANTTEVGTDGVAPSAGYTPTAAYAGANALSGTGNGATQDLAVCAKVDGAATFAVPAETYTDMVKVVLVF